MSHMHVVQLRLEGGGGGGRGGGGGEYVLLMTDSICHSLLPRTVLEQVTLTAIKFRIYPRTKVDPMFYCVYISMSLKSYPYKSSATCA